MLSPVSDAMAYANSAAVAEPPVSVLPEATDSVLPGTRSRGVDYAALWRQVEAESARVVVIDLDRRSILAGRIMTEAGAKYAYGIPDSPLERLFPGADAQVKAWAAELRQEPAVMVIHSLTPRHWAYFWRVDRKAAVLAVVRHRYGRGAVAAGDTATIRLLCEHWMAPEMQAMGIGRGAQKRWNRVDRRARAAAPRELRGALAALGLATACGLWLALGGAATPPAANAAPAAELQRLTRLSDEALGRSLAHALAARDRAQAQEILTDHVAMGHFASAILLDDRLQVVAHAGLATPPDVGLPLEAAASAALPAGMQRVSLRWAEAQAGQLLTVPRKVAPPPEPRAVTWAGAVSPDQALRAAGTALALAGLLSGALLWRHLRARYR